MKSSTERVSLPFRSSSFHLSEKAMFMTGTHTILVLSMVLIPASSGSMENIQMPLMKLPCRWNTLQEDSMESRVNMVIEVQSTAIWITCWLLREKRQVSSFSMQPSVITSRSPSRSMEASSGSRILHTIRVHTS